MAPHISGAMTRVRLKVARSKDSDLTRIRRSTMFGMIANLAVQSSASEEPWTNAPICRCHG